MLLYAEEWRAPEFGEARNEILQDIAVATGAKFISEHKGDSLKELTIDDFGSADRIISGSDYTTIIGRNGDANLIQSRVETIFDQIEKDRNMSQTWRFKKRIATLTGGVGVIYVGGNSEVEMKDNYYRIEDALSAAKAAIEEGYMPGGGIAYLNIYSKLRIPESNDDTIFGYKIFINSMKSPIETMLSNAGINISSVYEEIGDESDWRGLNLLTDEFGDMYDMGIIDPVKVVKAAIINAASVAGMILTTSCVITDK